LGHLALAIGGETNQLKGLLSVETGEQVPVPAQSGNTFSAVGP
jgi:hypothetical protein